eukprot:4819454-Karenia_brevis.AAC.1
MHNVTSFNADLSEQATSACENRCVDDKEPIIVDDPPDVFDFTAAMSGVARNEGSIFDATGYFAGHAVP